MQPDENDTIAARTTNTSLLCRAFRWVAIPRTVGDIGELGPIEILRQLATVFGAEEAH
jgi:hypothetical protein